MLWQFPNWERSFSIKSTPAKVHNGLVVTRNPQGSTFDNLIARHHEAHVDVLEWFRVWRVASYEYMPATDIIFIQGEAP